MNEGFYKYCFRLKPSDVLFFRETYAFNIGISNHIESLNIPYPSVFYGAITSMLIRDGYFENIKNSILKKSEDINEKLKEHFRIDGVYLYDQCTEEIYVKAPLDLFESEIRVKFGIYENGLVYTPKDSDQFNQIDNKFISVSDLINYYSKKNIKKKNLYLEDYFFCKYKKTGIQLNKDRGTTEEQCLYTMDMVEFSNRKFSYLISCSIKERIDTKLNSNILRLGGESKLAIATFIDKDIKEIEKLNNFYKYSIIKNSKIKVVLISPMIIQNYDEFIKQNNVKYIISGKPKYIGGFDMAMLKERSLEKALPEGSVLVLEDDNWNDKSIYNILKQGILKSKNEFKGFGKFIVMPFEEE